jgi:uncharacterized protein
MLNQFLSQINLSIRFAPKAVLAFIIFVSLICTSACGKRTPPVPPVEKVPQRATISGFQQGNQVKLRWTLPAQNVSDASILRIKQVDIYRLAETTSSPAYLTEEEFAARSTLIASVPVTDESLSGRQISFADLLEFAGQAVKLRYAVRFVNASGQKAAFSNFLLIEPTAGVAASPALLQSVVAQDAIRLKWQEPSANVDASRPANILGYNVYRTDDTEKADAPAQLLNSSPVRQNEFADRNFEFGKSYSYFVRAVSLGSNGQPVESADSNVASIAARDVFRPSPPTAITIAATPEAISIFFAPNPEPDVVGYHVFRSLVPDLPKSEWQNLTVSMLATNTFQDAKIERGKTFYYYVTAVDKFGNTSEPSEVVSETVP